MAASMSRRLSELQQGEIPFFLLSPKFCIAFWLFLLANVNANPYRHFSTKTPYNWVHNPVDFKDDELFTLPLRGMSCSAVHANVVARHGTRYPSQENAQEIDNVHEKIVAAMEPDTNPDIYNWKNQFPHNNAKALAHLGEEELESFGKRIATKLSSLFVEEDPANFRFITSSQVRTKQSASAFYEGFISIVGQGEEEEDEFDSEVNDDLMRFFDLCGRYVYEVKDNKTAMKEYLDFMNSERIIKINDKISDKLGIGKNILTPAEVRLIYLICGYERAIFTSSPWCSVLDEEDLKVLEYLGDLKHYYMNGYGHDIAWQQSCPLVSDIFSMMDETITEIESTEDDEEIDGFVVGQFAFGHAETVGPLMASLGLFNDSVPLKADNFESQEDRKFRTSEILPFASNIMFVLYECVPEHIGEEEEVDEVDYYIKTLVNEKPVVLPTCEDFHCPYYKVRDHFTNSVDSCHFQKLCKIKSVKDEL